MKVLIIDDSSLIGERIRELLNDDNTLNLLNQAYNIQEALVSIAENRPEILVLDIRMPGGSGMNLLNEVKKNYPEILVIVLSNYSEPVYRIKCQDLGADFFFDKSSEFEKVKEVISGVQLAKHY